MGTNESSETSKSASSLQRVRSNLFYWRLLNLDVVLLIVCYIIRPEIFEATLAKVKDVIAILVAALAFFGLVKGSVLKNEFSSFNELLQNTLARVTIGVVSLAIVSFTATALVSKECFESKLLVKASKRLQAVADSVGGRIIIEHVENSTKRRVDEKRIMLSNRPYESSALPLGMLNVIFLPDDSTSFESSEQLTQSELGTETLEISLQKRQYVARFNLTPSDARFTIESPPIGMVDLGRSYLLDRGEYKYHLEAGRNFLESRGTFMVPEDLPFQPRLTRRAIPFRFLLDRGLGKTSIQIPGIVVITTDIDTLSRRVGPGEVVYLLAGTAYRIHAIGNDPYDLRKRQYLRDLVLTPAQGEGVREFVIKVREQPRSK